LHLILVDFIYILVTSLREDVSDRLPIVAKEPTTKKNSVAFGPQANCAD
jgi:hypothetical protein